MCGRSRRSRPTSPSESAPWSSRMRDCRARKAPAGGSRCRGNAPASARSDPKNVNQMSQDVLSLDQLAALPAPFPCGVRQIEPQWIYHNGHMNMAYYNVILDDAVGGLFRPIGLGPDYLKQRNCSTMTAECHVRYLREVKLGDPVEVTMLILAADEKRIHFFEELRH